MNAPENILIVRTDRIGDVILSLPIAGIIKKHYPKCKITFLVREYTRSLVTTHPYIDEVLVLHESEKFSFFNNIKLISEKKFDFSIVVYPTFYISLIIFLSGIKNRIGTGYRWYSFLFNKKVFEHRKYAEKHELEFNVAMLNKIGIDETINPQNASFALQVDKSASSMVETMLTELKINPDRGIIIIHPGSGGSAVDLPGEKFRELVSKLEKDDYQILLTGSESEFNLCERLKVNDKVHNLAGKVTLNELIALINKCRLFISNSTGPIHIAAALNKNVVGFYPKVLSCSAKRWGPYISFQKKLLYEPEIDCDNCTTEQCAKLNCMNSINIEKVYSDINKVLS